MISIDIKYLGQIKDIIRREVPRAAVWAFGSRVEGTATTYSDLDIVINDGKEISSATINKLKEQFDKSDIPFRVDVLDWACITEEFRDLIEKRHEVIQRPAGKISRN